MESTETFIDETTVNITHDEYDGLNRLYQRTRTFGAQTNIETYDYFARSVEGAGTTYLPAARTQSINSAFNESFAYDKNGNIISINKNGSTVTYEYDNFNRLVRENNPMLDKTFTFAYNKGGNITAKREYAYTTGTPSVLVNEYEYGYENTYSDLLTYMKINGVQQDLFYDQMAHPLEHNGNPLSWAMGKLATYGTTAFNYSYDNTRLYKGTDYETVLYHYENGRLLGETRESFGEKKYIKYLYDHAGLIGFTLNGTVYRYILNLQGDITHICDATSGMVVAKYVYDAWGNHKVLNPDGTENTNSTFIGNINAIRYRGYYYDVETGLYYLITRYYDPIIGRFISPDDVSYLDPESINGLNLYAYCLNNPVMGIDPEGTAWWHWLVGSLVIAALAVATVATAGIAGVGIGAAFSAGFAGAAIGAGASGLAVTIAANAFAGAVIGAAIGIGTGALSGGLSTGTWQGALEGAGNGFMMGSITGAITGGIRGGITYKNTTPIFRSMSPDEANSIARTREFSTLAGQSEGKYFATTKNNAFEWGRLMYGDKPYKVIGARVLKSALNHPSVSYMPLDFIGNAYFFADMPFLNSIVSAIWFI